MLGLKIYKKKKKNMLSKSDCPVWLKDGNYVLFVFALSSVLIRVKFFLFT